MSITRSDLQLVGRRLGQRVRRGLACLGRERGSILVITVLLMPVTFGFLGLMLDGSLMYARRRELQDAADAAALAGAMQADLKWFSLTGRWRIAEERWWWDPLPGTRTADEAVQEVCAAYGVTCRSEVPGFHGGRLIRVTARTEYRPVLVHILVGRSRFRLETESAAVMVPGY